MHHLYLSIYCISLSSLPPCHFSFCLSDLMFSIRPYFLCPTLFSLFDLIFSIWPYFLYLTLFCLSDLIFSIWPYFLFLTLFSLSDLNFCLSLSLLYICPAMILCLSITLPWLNNLFTSVIARVNSLTENWYIFNLITQILYMYLRQQR